MQISDFIHIQISILKSLESWYIAYLATSGSKRETTNERTCALCLPTN